MTTSFVGPNGQWVTQADVPNKPIPTPANAKHSAVISASGIVYSGACILYGVKVVTAGTSITVYDNTAASGVSPITAEATTAAAAVISPAAPGAGVQMDTGIYLALTGGTYIVYYQPL